MPLRVTTRGLRLVQLVSSGLGALCRKLTASSTADVVVASVATLLTRLRENRKWDDTSVIAVPAMIERKAVMMSTPLRTPPSCRRSRAQLKMRSADVPDHGNAAAVTRHGTASAAWSQ